MIRIAPYDDRLAMSVLSDLDGNDLVEAQLVRGEYSSHLALWFDWRAMQPACALSRILRDGWRGDQPFAVLALSNSGQAGVAQAALLARPHHRHRRALIAAARRIADEMPAWCRARGIHRVEARSWDGHPTAARFLSACGFSREARMPGFGADGRAVFTQFAWTDASNLTGD